MGAMLQVRTYHGHDMPFVEVLVDGVWYTGDLRAWRQDDDHSWTAQVSWSKAAGETYLGIFAAEDVRPVEGAEEEASARWAAVQARMEADRAAGRDPRTGRPVDPQAG
jgi:hypothetical protein